MRVMTPEEERRDTWEAFVVVMSVSLLPFVCAALGLLLIHLGIVRVPDLDLSVPSARGLGSGLKTVVNFGMGGFFLSLIIGVVVLRGRIARERRLRQDDAGAA